MAGHWVAMRAAARVDLKAVERDLLSAASWDAQAVGWWVE